MTSRISALLSALVLVVLGALIAPAPAGATGAKCAAYQYAGTTRDLCNQFPGPSDRDCSEIGTPVTVVVKSYDPWNLDSDGDGGACETQVGQPPISTPTSKPTTRPTSKPTVKPSTKPTATATRTATRTASPSPSWTRTPEIIPAAGRPSLPVTGPSAPWLIGAAAALLLAGAGAVLAVRRKTRFEA